MMTTGGSLFSFATALREHGVARVEAVVVARNIGKGNGAWLRPQLEAEVAAGRSWEPDRSKHDVLP